MAKTIIIAVIILVLSNSLAYTQNKPAQTGSISGRVSSQMTKSPLRSVNVKLLNTNLGAITDANGKFSIKNIPVGLYSLQFSAIGYETYVQTDLMVNSAKPIDLSIELPEKIISLPGVEVRASYFVKKIESATSTQSLSSEDIRRAPGVQEDVIRAAALLPGVAVTSAGRNDLLVRGGAPFENLFIVDNLEVPNINHFGTQGTSGGPLSIINIDFVKDVSFSSGGFGARYGDKLSSLTNITLRNGNEEKFGGKVTLSATGFWAAMEGPIADKGSYFFSVRRSYLDLIFKAAGFAFIPEYWDFQGKANYRLDKKNSLSFLAIGAIGTVSLNNEDNDNRYDNSQVAIPEQNQYFTGLTWQHLFGKGFLNVTFGRIYTKYDTYQNDSNLVEIFRNSSIESENVLKTDLDWQLNDNMELTLGNQVKFNSKLDYNILLPAQYRYYFDDSGNRIGESLSVDTSFTAYRNESYASLTSSIGKLKFTVGGRLDYYNYLNHNINISPRASLVYQLNEMFAFTMSGGTYYQTPSFIWLIGDKSNKNLKPIKADQLVVGFEHTPLEDVKVQLEAYYKWYSDYPARLWRPQSVLSPSGFDDISYDIPYGLEPLTSGAVGWSRGVEFFVQKKLSHIPLYGLVSVTLSQTRFKAIDGVERAGKYDAALITNFVIGYRLNAEWEFSTKFRFSTGQPTTPFKPDGTIDYSRYNEGERLPVNHSLDLRVDKKWFFSNLSLVTYLDIQNLYARKNVSGYKWNYRTQSPEKQESFGILPSIGVSVEF